MSSETTFGARGACDSEVPILHRTERSAPLSHSGSPEPSDSADPVGIVGGGTMGAAIAQVAALAGHPVRIVDARPGAATGAVREIQDRVRRLAKRDLITGAAADAACARLSVAEGLPDLAGCVVVLEAIAEDLDAKHALLAALEEVVGDDTLLASNTSSLSITALGGRLSRPERLVGLHFFNPAARMKLVEVVRGELSGPAYVELAANLVRCWGKTPVHCVSTPGFIVNRVARPYYGEAQRMVEDGVADAATIDALLREAGGFPLGPLELTDLIGQDVNLAVAKSVWQQTFHDPRYAPTVWQQQLVDAGRLGRKAGRGVYGYDVSGGHAEAPVALDPRSGAPAAPWTSPRHLAPRYAVYQEGWNVMTPLLERAKAGGVQILGEQPEDEDVWDDDGCADHGGVRLPSGGRLIETTGDSAASVGNDIVLLDWALDPETTTRVALAAAPGVKPETVAQAIGLVQAAGVAVSVVDDSPGLVVARTIAMLINEAADVVHRGEASAADVDTAMRLGAGYPRGPLRWGDAIGAGCVAWVLRSMNDAVPTGRYRVGRGLELAAERGTPLHD
jgi:3-hydroxybutyryl-CoA dehydrogenase